MCIAFSKILLLLDKREIGLQFELSSLSPYLKIGIRWAILHCSGRMSVWKEILIIIANGILSVFLNSLRIRAGMGFGPTAFLEFNLDSISSSMTVPSKNEFMFW